MMGEGKRGRCHGRGESRGTEGDVGGLRLSRGHRRRRLAGTGGGKATPSSAACFLHPKDAPVSGGTGRRAGHHGSLRHRAGLWALLPLRSRLSRDRGGALVCCCNRSAAACHGPFGLRHDLARLAAAASGRLDGARRRGRLPHPRGHALRGHRKRPAGHGHAGCAGDDGCRRPSAVARERRARRDPLSHRGRSHPRSGIEARARRRDHAGADEACAHSDRQRHRGAGADQPAVGAGACRPQRFRFRCLFRR